MAVRALAGARRWLRSLCVFKSIFMMDIADRPALPVDAPPARRLNATGCQETRQTRPVPACLRSCPLPRALANEDELEAAHLQRLAVCHRDGDDLCGLERRPQYARVLALQPAGA